MNGPFAIDEKLAMLTASLLDKRVNAAGEYAPRGRPHSIAEDWAARPVPVRGGSR
jgi:hypothetical protein